MNEERNLCPAHSLSCAPHEGVVPPLVAESATGAVAGHKGGVIAQGPELAGDAVYQLRMKKPSEI